MTKFKRLQNHDLLIGFYTTGIFACDMTADGPALKEGDFDWKKLDIENTDESLLKDIAQTFDLSVGDVQSVLSFQSHSEYFGGFSAEKAKPELACLVVDDNEICLRVTSAILVKFGYTVDVVANPLDSLLLIKNNDYRIIFLDFSMPELDGLQCAERIQTNCRAAGKTVPRIVLHTATLSKAIQDGVRQLGLDGALHKPVSPREFEGLLKKFSPKAA